MPPDLQERQKMQDLQEMQGHKNIRTKMIDTHAQNRSGRGVINPLDR